MGGGPFRDTMTPLIADAQRQLAALRREHARLEEIAAATQRHRTAERKGNPSRRARFFRGFVFGTVVGLPFSTAFFILLMRK
jgi:hypothetical protein